MKNLNVDLKLTEYKKSLEQSILYLNGQLPFEIEERIKGKVKSLIAEMEKAHYIKVPFIGDFSAGKSTLLNAYIGRDELLPTSVRPETAVSYELYYAPVETVIQYRDGKEIDNKAIGDLKELEVEPGDIVSVFVNNLKIKALNDADIVLVDMPGLDSGIKAHHKAISSYLQQGTAFVTLVDIEQGSIKQSTLAFLKEIKDYNLSPFILISKSDKKPEEEIQKIKEYIQNQVKRYIKEDVVIGVVSSTKNRVEDMDNIINSLDSIKLFEEKFSTNVQNILDEIITMLTIEENLLSNDLEISQKHLETLKNDASNAIIQISETKTSSKISKLATDTILQDIKQALIERESNIVALMMRNPNDQNIAIQEVISIVRPVMINSLNKVKLRISDDLQIKVSEITESYSLFTENDRRIPIQLESAESIKAFLINDVKPFTDKLFKNNEKYKLIVGALAIGTSVVAPWVEIAILVLPEVLKFLSEKSNEEKQHEYATHYNYTIIPNVLDKLYPVIESSIKEQQESIAAEIIENIKEEVKNIEISVVAREKEHSETKEQIDTRLVLLSEAISKIDQLKISVIA